MRILLLLFLAALLGNHLEIPPKSIHGTLGARSHGEQSRGRECLEKPFESLASELAAAFPVVPSVLWSPGLGARVGGVCCWLHTAAPGSFLENLGIAQSFSPEPS